MTVKNILFAAMLAASAPGVSALAKSDEVGLCGAAGPAERMMRSVLEPSEALDQPGFVFALTCRDGRQIVIRSGAGDIEQARANSSETVFHLASLSKQITAAAVAMAIQDGLITLDDPLAAHIEEARRFGDALTLAHLMYMSSGLPEYTSLPRETEEPWTTFHYFDVEEAISVVLEHGELQFEPGSQWAYTNINFMLLAEVVERVYGQPFSDIVRDRIFAALDMDASLINDDTTQLIPHRANGYTARTDAVVATLNAQGGIHIAPGEGWVLLRRNSPHYGGSGAFSSIRDWGRWQAEMMIQDQLGEAFWSLMLTTRSFDHPKHNDAFGLVLDEWEGRTVYWYSGGDIDTSTFSAVFPDAGSGVACFANDPFADCEAKTRAVVRALMAADHL